ncbi:MAG: hypothetical protein FJZ67_11840 [Bacteroidetes bacterium]|nr:hypothetical protein [Bacteroidota bacterium]
MKTLILVLFSIIFSFVCSAQYKTNKIDTIGNPNAIILKVPVLSFPKKEGNFKTFKPIFSRAPESYCIDISNPTTKTIVFSSYDYKEEWSAADFVKQGFLVEIDYTDECDNSYHMESMLHHWR